MENNQAFGFGFIIFLLSGVSLFWFNYNSPFFLLLYGIGAAAFCVSGILYLVGGVKNSSNTIGTAFGFGLPAWTLIIISCIVGISWNKISLDMANFQIILIFKYVLPNLDFEDYYSVELFMIIITSIPNTRKFNIGYVGSITHLFFAISGFIFGLLALISIMKRKW